MITEGSKVMVIPSPELSEIKLGGILGEEGIVLEDLTDNEGTADGYMVLFPASYQGEYVWFIPKNSAYEQD